MRRRATASREHVRRGQSRRCDRRRSTGARFRPRAASVRVASREKEPIVFRDDVEREPEIAAARKKGIGLDCLVGIATLGLACIDEAMPSVDAARLRVCAHERGDIVIGLCRAHGIGKRVDGDTERVEHDRREARNEIFADFTTRERRTNFVDRTR